MQFLFTVCDPFKYIQNVYNITSCISMIFLIKHVLFIMLEEMMILEHYAGGSITAKNTILIVLTIDKFLQVVTFDT